MDRACKMSILCFMCILASTIAAPLSVTHSEATEADLGLQTVDPTNWLRECVPPFKRFNFTDNTNTDWSDYWNREMPSGLCAAALTCAFKGCPVLSNAANRTLIATDLNAVMYKDVSTSLPELNLPAKISFPNSVKGLVDIVTYADQNNMGISIKNVGHSYSGSCNEKGSVQFNLRDFPHYSRKSITLCNAAAMTNDYPCMLARARQKPAKVRVGGGELFDDYYRAVMDWNTREGRFLPEPLMLAAVGGGIGTVGAAGGWLQGGGLSIGLDRIWGLGVDQVLEVEMVLANSVHVKFGPTQWIEGNHSLFPQTTKVEGKCNTNMDVDERKWIWEDCKAPVAWEDLWFAVRGGGGGTWGVVTAVTTQLHSSEVVNHLKLNMSHAVAVLAANPVLAQSVIIDFFIDFMFNPANVGVDEETSNNCGNTGYSLSVVTGGIAAGLLCNGDHALKGVQAWVKYVTNVLAVEHSEFVTRAGLENIQNAFGVETIYSYNINHMVTNLQNPFLTRSPVGSIPDLQGGGPTIWSPYMGLWNAAMPIQWLVSKNLEVKAYLAMVGPSLHTQGGVSQYSGDGMDAVPRQVRQAGFVGPIYPSAVASQYRNAMRKFQPAQSMGAYPPDTEYNHMSPDVVGPLKSNYEHRCDPNFTYVEQRDKCVSWEDTVWGAETHAKLLTIKKQLDPKNLFNCYRCIGYEEKTNTLMV